MAGTSNHTQGPEHMQIARVLGPNHETGHEPVKLKNHKIEWEYTDMLVTKLNDFTQIATRCTPDVCSGSIMGIPGRGDTPYSPTQVYLDAEKFIKEYFTSIKRENSVPHMSRMKEIELEIKKRGTYELKLPELVFGTKLAWRNATRCIGRIQWKKLQVFDCREVTTASGMFEALCTHIKYATNKGNIRSAITIFPQRTDGKHDYKIWNPQLINYAGYRQQDGSILGDPGRLEFTEVCIRLGWKPPYTRWDILPLVLSADGKDPEYFDIPRDIVMEVQMEHPKFDWFKKLGLRWYALPAVANMRFDCGGIEFTATAFNGWYMGTEVGCRNFGDSNRLDMVETVANKMGLDTNSYVSMWKDQALVEINKAVLHSFQRDIVSIVDHHSASEQFIKHLENENRSRGGCPSDWIWVVPPMSSSLTQVFHQEMALYYLRPSYDYQDAAWLTYQWPDDHNKPPRKKFHFKPIARAVKFSSTLYRRALSKRVKATILYATETGKSEQYAKELGNIFGLAFNAQVMCMDDYDVFSIEHETLLLIVTSTFGNGEPPANGFKFAEYLFKMLIQESDLQGEDTEVDKNGVRTPTAKSLMRTNSMITPVNDVKRQLSRLESNKSTTGGSSIENIGPLSNILFAVFALGSSAYPKYCNFGKNMDRVLGELGGERIMEIATGDEMYGQEQEFRSWSTNIFKVACDIFCLDDTYDPNDSSTNMPLSEETVRFGVPDIEMSLKDALASSCRKQLVTCKTIEVHTLGDKVADRETVFINIEPTAEFKYDPGDHVGVMPCNRTEIVEAILDRLRDKEDFDSLLQVQVMKKLLSPMGSIKKWEKHERLQPATIRDLFMRFLDITTPPSTTILKYLATTCSDKKDVERITELVSDSTKYDDWRHLHYPHLAEVLEMFPSCMPMGSFLAVILPALQPRFYSISSSPLAHLKQIHCTVAVVRYQTKGGTGPTHYGVCSNYLKNLQVNEEVLVFSRRAPNFHMPKDLLLPIILIGPGSGVAPFRGFWHQRRELMKKLKKDAKTGPIWLFFGCRTKGMDIYEDEKAQAVKDGALTKTFLALSREKGVPKKYVQMLLEEQGAEVTKMLVDHGGHFFVCGDCKMAEEVQQTLKSLIKKHAHMSDQDADNFMIKLMDDIRYHEDIFGITLRTAEVQTKSRESARRSRLESAKSQ